MFVSILENIRGLWDFFGFVNVRKVHIMLGNLSMKHCRDQTRHKRKPFINVDK